MIVHKLVLKNFCQHRSFELELTPGLNLLMGPNGSGKTNILRALQFALVGDAGGDRAKADDVYQGIANGDASFVQAELEHAGEHILIKRGLSPQQNRMEIGDQSWTTVGDINAELWRRLGATKKQLADYVFVRQRKIDEMFDQRPAERAASLASLFGVDHAAKIYSKIGEFLNGIEVPTTTFDEDTIKGEIADHEETLRTINQSIADLSMPENPVEFLQEQLQIISDYRNRQKLSLTSDRLTREQARLLGEKTRKQEPLAAYEEQIALLQQTIADMDQECEAAQRALERWHAYHSAAEIRKGIERDKEELAQEAQSLNEPAAPTTLRLTAEEQETLTSSRARLAQVDSSLACLNDAVDCPTCGQRLPDVEQRTSQRARLQYERDKLAGLVATLAERDSLWVAFDTENAKYNKARTELARREQQLTAREDSLQELGAPELSADDARATLAEREGYRKAVNDIVVERDKLAVEVSSISGQLSQVASELYNARQAILQLPALTLAQYNAAMEQYNTVQAQQERLSTLERRKAVAEANKQAAERALADVRAVMESGRKTRETVKHLTEVRSIFHRNEAPRIVSYTYVEAMLSKVNDALDLFDAPFRVEMDENLGFNARFLDGVRYQPDKRLSIGERIVLALAFRITVNSTFAGQVGMLVMDEPTAGLDEHNLGSLPNALERLRELSHSHGLQVLFVTHEPRIAHHFDNTSELSAA